MRNSTVILLAMLLISVGVTVSRAQEAACTFLVFPAILFPEATGENGQVTVMGSTDACAFSVKSDSPWVTVSPAEGQGKAYVKIQIGKNEAPKQRIGFIFVGKEEVPVIQSGTATPGS